MDTPASGCFLSWRPLLRVEGGLFTEMGWGPLTDSAGVMLPWGPASCGFLGLRAGGWVGSARASGEDLGLGVENTLTLEVLGWEPAAR